MNTLKKFANLFIFVLIFSSCAKVDENIDTQDTVAISNTPAEGSDQDEIAGQDFSKSMEESTSFENLISPDRESEASGRRGGIYITSNYGSGGYGNAILKCGNRVTSTTIGARNQYDNNFYNRLGFNTNLNGGDDQFYIELTQDQLVRLDLTNTRNNMAMVLFKGSWVCTVRNGIFYVEERFDELVSYSTSNLKYEEHLGPLSLEAGKYLLIIDGAPGLSSNFNLQINCQNSFYSCDGSNYGLIYDDFQSYSTGNVSSQSYLWEKWNASSLYDGQVGRSSDGNKYLWVERKNNVSTANQPDVLLNIGERGQNERIKVSFKMYIYSGRTAHFNIQKYIASEWGGQIFFYGNGTGEVKLSNKKFTFTYTRNKWMQVELDINLRNNQTTMYLDGSRKAGWASRESHNSTNGSLRFEAINFYPFDSNSQFFVDNVCVSEL